MRVIQIHIAQPAIPAAAVPITRHQTVLPSPRPAIPVQHVLPVTDIRAEHVVHALAENAA